MGFEIELKTQAVWYGKDSFSNEECCEIMDAVIGKMTGHNLDYWVRHGQFIDEIKGRMK